MKIPKRSLQTSAFTQVKDPKFGKLLVQRRKEEARQIIEERKHLPSNFKKRYPNLVPPSKKNIY